MHAPTVAKRLSVGESVGGSALKIWKWCDYIALNRQQHQIIYRLFFFTVFDWSSVGETVYKMHTGVSGEIDCAATNKP